MKRLIVIIIMCLAFAPTMSAQRSMWLVAGQSNASGMGDRRTSMKYISSSCFEYVESGDSLRVLKDPVGENGKFLACSVSGSIVPAFASKYNKLTGREVIAVSAARGGSSCCTKGETLYGTWAMEGTLSIFQAAVEKARKAMTLTGENFEGIIWLQGERDANAVNDGKMTGKEYEAALKDLIKRFRKDLGNKDLPFYIVLTGQYMGHPEKGYYQIRSAQRRVCNSVLGVHLVSFDPWIFPELNMMTDSIHYSQLGYNLIGEALARQVFEESL